MAASAKQSDQCSNDIGVKFVATPWPHEILPQSIFQHSFTESPQNRGR